MDSLSAKNAAIKQGWNSEDFDRLTELFENSDNLIGWWDTEKEVVSTLAAVEKFSRPNWLFDLFIVERSDCSKHAIWYVGKDIDYITACLTKTCKQHDVKIDRAELHRLVGEGRIAAIRLTDVDAFSKTHEIAESLERIMFEDNGLTSTYKIEGNLNSVVSYYLIQQPVS